MKRIAFTALNQAELIEGPENTEPLGPAEIRGKTLVTLVSPGTELNWGFLGKTFPMYPGYACIFRVEETGLEVQDIKLGTTVLSMGGHSESQKVARQAALVIPAGLPPETAIFARLAGVSMSALNCTAIRPPARVLVTGLGPVGILAAQIFSAAGYEVSAIDPAESRRQTAKSLGVKNVSSTAAELNIENQISLHIECSGHEQAVLDGCRCLRKGGELFLVGVPWRRNTEIYAHDLLHAIFHRYIILRSGWEWQVPVHRQDFSQHSILDNHTTAMQWLADRRLNVEGLAGLYKPTLAQEVYSGLLDQSLATPTALFDWR